MERLKIIDDLFDDTTLSIQKSKCLLAQINHTKCLLAHIINKYSEGNENIDELLVKEQKKHWRNWSAGESKLFLEMIEDYTLSAYTLLSPENHISIK